MDTERSFIQSNKPAKTNELPPHDVRYKLGDSPANLLINRGVMTTLQERRLGYHSRAGLEPGTSRFSTLRINYYAARGIRYNKAHQAMV
jgi:hypothetical protein